MVVDVTFSQDELPRDEQAEDVFETAIAAWRMARARIEAVCPAQLSSSSRSAYYRLLARIGLWADALLLKETHNDAEPEIDTHPADRDVQDETGVTKKAMDLETAGDVREAGS